MSLQFRTGSMFLASGRVDVIKHLINVENITQVCVLSYNSRGFCESKQQFCDNLSTNLCGNRIPILCIQEHFLLRGNSYIAQQALPQSHIFFKPAVKTDQDNGRPKNGMLTAVPKNIKERFIDISPTHWRIQAVRFGDLVIISVYLPTDPGTMAFDDNDLLDTLNVVESVIDSNPGTRIVITGDLNADFSRNSGHVRTIRNFVDNLGLKLSWNRFQVDFTHISMRNEEAYVHTLDHFMWGEGTEHAITDAGVIHHVDNESDHSPIYCNLDILDDVRDIPKKATTTKAKPSWQRASDEEKSAYVFLLSEKLENVRKESLTCNDPNCDDINHRNNTDNAVEDVLNAICESAAEALPKKTSRGDKSDRVKKLIPGWHEQVRPYRDKARFWYAVWASAGKPLNCQLHFIMRRTKNIYHYQLKKCKKAELEIKKQKLLSAMLAPDSDTDIFKEIRKMRRTAPATANKIDDKTENIQEHFASIYSGLYNSVDDYDDLMKVTKEIESKISESSCQEVEKVTAELVKEAVKHIKPNKSDPVCSFTSDVIKNAPDILYVHLADIIKSFLIHSHISSILLLATLVPIIKDKLGNLCSSKNYRSIAISSLFLKIVDWIIILLYGESLQLDDLQFAYQPSCSTNMCTWLVVETIDYFIRNGGDVFACSMDMSKAFDLVVHSKLLRKLMEASMPAIVVRLLLVMYLTQYANVRWDGMFSAIFSLKNGCKQGAVLSAIAYCVYVNGLFQELRRNRSGCWVENSFLGILGYSDDNILLAPSIEALQDMLNICEKYAASHGLKFSTDPNPNKSKTRCLAFLQRERNLRPVLLCGNKLPWIASCKHLGNTIVTKELAENGDIRSQDVKIKRGQSLFKSFSLHIQELLQV